MIAHGALALGRLHHAGLEILGHRGERLVGAGGVHAAARVDDRASGAEQHAGGPLDVGIRRRRALHRHRRQQLGLALLLQRVGRDLQVHGPRAPGLELAHRLVDGGGDLVDLQHALAPFGHGGHDVELLVDLVEHADVLAEVAARHLAGHQEHRRRARVGGAEPGAGVQHARPRHHQRHPEAAAGPRVAVGHVGGGLLVARQDEAHVLLVAQGGHGAVQLHARQPEHDPSTFPMQLLDERLASRLLSAGADEQRGGSLRHIQRFQLPHLGRDNGERGVRLAGVREELRAAGLEVPHADEHFVPTTIVSVHDASFWCRIMKGALSKVLTRRLKRSDRPVRRRSWTWP